MRSRGNRPSEILSRTTRRTASFTIGLLLTGSRRCADFNTLSTSAEPVQAIAKAGGRAVQSRRLGLLSLARGVFEAEGPAIGPPSFGPDRTPPDRQGRSRPLAPDDRMKL